jgi:hypothetical protein
MSIHVVSSGDSGPGSIVKVRKLDLAAPQAQAVEAGVPAVVEVAL